MNLLARILSHGFALALVALIAIALMYRGDLFQEWDLPKFLVIDDTSAPEQAETPPGAVSSPTDAIIPGHEQTQVTPEQVAGSPDAGDGAVSEPAGMALESAADEISPGETHTTEIIEFTDEVVEEPAVTTDVETAEPVEEVDVSTTDASVEAGTGYGEPPTTDVDTDASNLQESPASTSSTEDTGLHKEEETNADQATSASDTAPVKERIADDASGQPAAANAPVLVAELPGTEDISEAEAEAVVAEAEVAEVAEAEAEAEAESAVVQAPEPPTPETAAAPIEKNNEKSAYELLAVAREAYWLRDFEGAEKYYNQLIRIEPENPDGYGELGNLYFAQGKWEQAAAAYYEAGVRMIDEGLLVQAGQLVGVIRGLNGDQADELEQQINNATRNLDTP